MSRDVQQGELVVDTLAIANLEQESIDIQALTSNITIFEAIDKPFLSGRLTLVDGLKKKLCCVKKYISMDTQNVVNYKLIIYKMII